MGLYFILDDYQQLAPGEEKDLNVTMSRCECAISNIEAFTEKLSRDLSLLDGVSLFHRLKVSLCTFLLNNTNYIYVIIVMNGQNRFNRFNDIFSTP